MRTSHPIEVDVKSPSEINQIFDAISYSKGASVIRMLVHFLGDAAFVSGVRAYLTRHKFKNATTADLWTALSESSGKPVGAMMASWTRQVGYPVVRCALHAHGNDKNGQKEGQKDGKSVLDVSQTRFLSSGDATEAESTSTWYVPLSVRTSAASPAVMETLSERTSSVTVPSGEFVKLNDGQRGFYRVLYDDALLALIGPAVASQSVSAADRVGIISDAFALSYAGLTPVTRYLRLLPFYANEAHSVAWDEIVATLGALRSAWYEEPADVTEGLRKLAVKLFAPRAHSLGWEFAAGEAHGEALLRSLLVAAAGRAGDERVVSEAKERFARFVAGDGKAVHPNLRGAMFTIAVTHGGKDAFEGVLQVYRASALPDEKNQALAALAAVQEQDLVARALGLALSDDVRSQDVPLLLAALAANYKARNALWDFVRANWATLYAKFYSGSFLLGRIVSAALDSFASEARAAEAEAFFAQFKGEDIASIDRSIKQSVEKIRSNAKWVDRSREETAAWLRENQQ